jgi:aryl-alcohol dehydrogenase-like predicted oxidoreductase
MWFFVIRRTSRHLGRKASRGVLSRRHVPRTSAGAPPAVEVKVLFNTVRSIAEAHGATPAQVALAWVMAQSGRLGIPVVPILGTKHAARVEENARAADIELHAGELASLSALADDVAGARY